MPTNVNHKVKVTSEIPPALRAAVGGRATNLGLPLITVVAAALTWFVEHHNHNELPPLLIDPKNLPSVPSTHPRTLSMELPNDLVAELDEIAGGGEHGSDRSSVIRTALCYYLSACGSMYRTRFTSAAHLMNI